MSDDTVEVPAVTVPQMLVNNVYLELGVAAMNHRFHGDYGIAGELEKRRELLEEYVDIGEGD